VKAVALGADIIDRFTTNASPIRITYGPDIVAGKKGNPHVSRLFLVYNLYIQTQSNGNNNNNKNTKNNSSSNTNWMSGKAVGNPGTGNNGNDKSLGNAGNGNTFWFTFSVIPQLYSPAASSAVVTGRLSSGTFSIGGLTNIALPNATATVTTNVSPGYSPVFATNFSGNSAAMGFFALSYGWQGSITNSTISVTLNGLSFSLDDGSGVVSLEFRDKRCLGRIGRGFRANVVHRDVDQYLLQHHGHGNSRPGRRDRRVLRSEDAAGGGGDKQDAPGWGH